MIILLGTCMSQFSYNFDSSKFLVPGLYRSKLFLSCLSFCQYCILNSSNSPWGGPHNFHEPRAHLQVVHFSQLGDELTASSQKVILAKYPDKTFTFTVFILPASYCPSQRKMLLNMKLKLEWWFFREAFKNKRICGPELRESSFFPRVRERCY